MPRHKSRLIRLAPIVTLIALALALPASASACPGAGQPSSQLGTDQAQDAIRCLINGVREKRGKKKLRQRDTLEAAAQYHSIDMAVAGYFSHDAPDGSSSFDRAISFGYLKGSGGAGEVIAGGDASFTPASALGDWMSSGGHRSVVLDRSWRHIGVGMAYVSGEVLYTVDFGHH
jgi:uncharacterized protein YkwD